MNRTNEKQPPDDQQRLDSPIRMVRDKRPVGLLRWTINLLLFLAAFFAVARLLAPRRSTDTILQAKLDAFAQHKDEYELIFFGSSRIYRAFDPRLFARETARGDKDVQAFNFGVGAMRPHEMNDLIRRVLAMRPAKLRWVMVELMHWEPTISEDILDQPRTVDWHNFRETASALRTLWKANLPAAKKWERAGTHFDYAFKRLTNWARGERRLRELWGRQPNTQDFVQYLVRSGGYVAIDFEQGPQYSQRRQQFLTKYYDIFLQQIEEIPASQKKPDDLPHFNIAATQLQQEMIRKTGAMSIYVIPNVRWGTPTLHRLAKEGIVDNFIALNDPLSLPELYRAEHYFDRGHLNLQGSIHFTRKLAQHYLDLTRQR